MICRSSGVPKLQRSELERACEDFSNIVASYPHYTVYKGTLSTGVEIAVVSTMITSSKEWTEHSESCFRRKVTIRIVDKTAHPFGNLCVVAN